ncbi:MAG: prepilin-type N-terminal cleavage/methylation domain-containing protein [Planctomycetota bacterium]|jgi:prepilin-type N-terminal cleavage/methylation domain-containing protein
MKKKGQTPISQSGGFTIVEVMMSLVILAILMTAVAFAFDASVTNYQQNRGIYETVNTGRQALLRITNDLRTADDLALSTEEANTQVSFIKDTTGDGTYDKNVTYRFDSDTNTLYYDDNITSNSYVLCSNVTAATFDRTEHQIDRDNGIGGVDTIWAVRDVRITLTVTDESGNVSKTLAAATLVRKNQ